MAERLTSLWYETHTCAYRYPMQKMIFEENQHLTAFTPTNFLWELSTSFLRITCKPCVLQWFRSSFTAKTDPSITMLHLQTTGHSLFPQLGSLDMGHSSCTWTLLISLVGGTEKSPANSLGELWWCLFQGFISTHSTRFPSMPVLFGSSNQIACSYVVCAFQQHASVFNNCDSSLWKMSMRFLYCFMSHTLYSTNNTCCT